MSNVHLVGPSELRIAIIGAGRAATGRRADRCLRRIKGVGRDGISLGEVLVQRPSAYLAVALSALPSLFMLNGPDGPVGNFSPIDDRGIPSRGHRRSPNSARRRPHQTCPLTS